jgi:hypothetical protein
MERADTAAHSGNHHDPPTVNHTADAATAMSAKVATGTYGVLTEFRIRHHASAPAEALASLSGIAIVSPLVFIADTTFHLSIFRRE